MADNEIKKAWECCIPLSERKCKECPYHEFRFRCITQLIKDTIDLINRQNEEIEALKIENQSLRSAANSYKIHHNEARAESVKEFAERLKETKFKQGNDYIIYASNIDILAEEMVGDNK